MLGPGPQQLGYPKMRHLTQMMKMVPTQKIRELYLFAHFQLLGTAFAFLSCGSRVGVAKLRDPNIDLKKETMIHVLRPYRGF